MEQNDFNSQKMSSIIVLLTNINNKLKGIEETLQKSRPQALMQDNNTHYTPIFFSDEEYYNYGD